MPSEAIIQKALASIRKGRANYDYFFKSLTSPVWIEPLAAHGLFTEPPAPIQEGNLIRFPNWPESEYLARVAGQAPELVVKILLALPDVENPRVQEDVADAALAMPPNVAARLTKQFCNYLEQTRYHLLYPEGLAKVVIHFATGGMSKQALRIARSYLSLRLMELPTGARPEPTSVVDVHDFEEFIEKHVPTLMETSGAEVFELLCDALSNYLRMSHPLDDNDFRDWLYINRPAIEDHEQNWGQGVLNPLVKGVRDAAYFRVTKDNAPLVDIIRQLEDRNWTLFKRIAINLIAELNVVSDDVLVSHLVNKDNYEDTGMRHEYARLSARHFGDLSESDQLIFLGWIDEQDEVEIRDWLARSRDAEPVQEEIKRVANIKRLQRLAPIKDSLPKDWKVRFDELCALYGEPAHADFLFHRSATWIGQTSPKESDDLAAMTVPEIASFLRSWVPDSKAFDGPTPEGLGRDLEKVVTDQPAKFASEARLFAGLDPTYIRSLVRGLNDAIRNGRSFEWAEVLLLCEWVVGQPREIAVPRVRMSEDPDWGWTRQQIASLLDNALAKESSELGLENERAVWQILLALMDDPDPTPDHEEQYGGSNMDPSTMAINSVRGEALSGVIHFGLWLTRATEKEGQRIAAIDERPEIRALLDRHLNPELDPSSAIRSLYGKFLPWIELMGPDWTKSNLSAIFSPREDPLWNVAWNAYIAFCDPFNKMLEVLHDQYREAIEHPWEKGDVRVLRDPEECLGIHLMAFYNRGKLNLDDPTSLIRLFFEKSSSQVRAKAMSSFGNDVRQLEESLPEINKERFQALWDWRLNEAKAAPDKSEFEDELSKFGWWFPASSLDVDWAVQTLRDVLKIARKIDPGHLVIQHLAEVADQRPRDALEILKLLLNSRLERWDVYGWRDEIEAILRVCLSVKEPDLVALATQTVHDLGARGEFRYRSLLDSGGI